jgi:uncharacterized RDD family membrane protein YckC
MATYPPPPSTPASGPTGPRAGFWRRFAALLIDGLVVGIPALVLIGIGAGVNSGALLVVGWLLGAVGGIAYEIYFIGSPSGQTPGKRALGIRVVDFATGGPIGYGRSTLRLIGRYISAVVCYLGYLWMLWDREKQCWHDKMANDVVVPTEYYPVT